MLLLILFLTINDSIPTYYMDEVVVTASRVQETMRNIPLGTTVITSREIENSGKETVGNILRGRTGIDVRSSGSMGAVTSVSLRGSYSNQVLVLIDGRPINSVSLGMADLSDLSLSWVKRIEVVKGPLSSVYGADALGGVVNIITKKGPNSEGAVSIGSHSTRLVSGKTGIKGTRLFGEKRESSGIRTNSDFSSYRFNLIHSYHPKKNIFLDLSLGSMSAKRGVPGPEPEKGKIPQYGDSLSTSLFDNQRDENYFADISFGTRGKLVDLKTKFYGDRREQRFFRVFNGYNPDWTTYRAESREVYKTQVVGFNGMANLKLPVAKVSMGVDHRENRLNAESVMRKTENDSTVASTNWSPQNRETGLWIEGKGTYSWLYIFPSLRYDRDSNYGGFLSPSLGFTFHPLNNLSLKLFGGRAFRAPTLNDEFWPGMGNRNLKPEIGDSYEFRVESSLYKVYTGVSLFKRNTRNLIAWSPEGGIWTPKNINSYKCEGIEYEFRTELARRMNIRTDFTFLRGKIRDKVAGETRALPYIPNVILSGGINYKIDRNTFLCMDLRYTGKRTQYYFNGTKHMKPASVADMNIRRSFGDFVVSLSIKNLFNERYSENFGNSIYDRNYPMPGRGIYFKVGFH